MTDEPLLSGDSGMEINQWWSGRKLERRRRKGGRDRENKIVELYSNTMPFYSHSTVRSTYVIANDTT